MCLRHTRTHTQKGFLNVELRKKSDSKKNFFKMLAAVKRCTEFDARSFFFGYHRNLRPRLHETANIKKSKLLLVIKTMKITESS